MTDQIGLAVRDLRKSYGSNTVLKGVNLELLKGRVHALLGANGAGKSTLLSCLSGAARPDSGEIVVGGGTHTGFTPQQAFDAGVAIIYQHFQLIGSLSVADNVFLGAELRTGPGFVDRKRQHEETREVFRMLGLDIDPQRTVETLSVGEQQMVEIARADTYVAGSLVAVNGNYLGGVTWLSSSLSMRLRLTREGAHHLKGWALSLAATELPRLAPALN